MFETKNTNIAKYHVIQLSNIMNYLSLFHTTQTRIKAENNNLLIKTL